MGAGRVIGAGFVSARDALARGLVALGVRPNTLTLVGLALTLAAGVCLAVGAGDSHAWNIGAVALLVLASATDMLDGAVARIGNLATSFGAFLDSTLDRVSDFAIFAGIGCHYAWRGNVTFTLLAMLCFANAFAISYTRARAEDLIDRCRVGYWQRGERMAAILFGAAAFNVPAMLLQQAISPAFTVWRRVRYTWLVTAGQTPPEHPRQEPWWQRLQPWRWPRMSLPYDLITAANIAYLVFAPIPQTDWLRRWISG